MNLLFLPPGLMVLHSHRAERLLDVVVAWLHQHPLGPLEEEVFIVQSNAVAEWLRMALARELGVCAATRVELPGRFFWRISRRVLGPRAVPTDSPLDKLPLAWRLMECLPALLEAASAGGDHEPAQGRPKLASAPLGGAATAGSVGGDLYAPLAAFVGTDPEQRLWPLCQRLADLYDQYQVYRPDWLDLWAQGRAEVTDGAGRLTPLPPDQHWQARLWQVLHSGIGPEQQRTTRPALMRRVQEQLEHGMPVQPLPRRVVAFGMSHLPPGMLALLGAVSRHSQVLLAVPNPCQYHWADVIDGRELLRSAHRRQPLKGGVDRAALPLHELHTHAHPLLAAWGRQSRDFVRLLDDLDDAAQGRAQPGWPRLDLFVDDTDPQDAHPRSLLRQLQTRIRDLVPLHELPQQPGHGWTPDDRSIVFHLAHSPVRELEVLHDQLLALLGGAGAGAPEPAPGRPKLANAPSGGSEAPPGASVGAPLTPKDVVVMVPDIAPLAPAIRAVFGQYPKGDARHIPFDIADLGADALSPLVQAWRWLWRLPTERAGLSEWLSLLEVPAVQARFGLDPEDLPRLSAWMAGAGLRWGLHAEQRRHLGLPDLDDTHTARFALRRMLWGYLLGDASGTEDSPEPYPEVAGLDAALAGVLAHLLDALDAWWTQATQPATPTEWVARGRALLAAVFWGEAQRESPRAQATQSPADQAALAALEQAGERWLDACEQAGFQQAVPLEVARTAWDHALQLPDAPSRFHAGGVTFCTLLPMRAIPFRVVCLLGMNDADYPRRAPRPDLDLIARPGMARPGDRSRRDDDRQLMLEALLSARDVLYISWCGHSVRDNTEQPPSVLVSQLRDHLAAGWGQPVVDALTTAHPLQPFSLRYLQGHPQLFTHAHEWRDGVHGEELQNQEHSALSEKALEAKKASNPGEADPAATPPWTLRDLAESLRHPVRTHFRRRLGIHFDTDEGDTPDEEPFALDGLQRHALLRDALDQLAANPDPQPPIQPQAATVHAWLQRAHRAGRLPLGAPGQWLQAQLLPVITQAWTAWQRVQQACPQAAERRALHWPPTVAANASAPPAPPPTPASVTVLDWIDGLHHPDPASPAWAALCDTWPELSALDATHTVCRWRDPSRVLKQPPGKTPKADPARLLTVWLRSLALSATAATPQHAHLLWVAQDATLWVRPLSRADASTALDRLLAHAALALHTPLPLPPRTALALVQARTEPGDDPGTDAPALPLARLRTAYEGSPDLPGEVNDPYWSRCYPDLDALLADGHLLALAPALWGPLVDWAQQQVAVWPHAQGPDDAEASEAQA
jgi:exodeoxyribonuclease V gamma subunit